MKKETISTKKEWIRSDAWRGYERPINWIVSANDTGTWDDSPYNSNSVNQDLNKAKKLLKKHGIKFRSVTCRTSNVFCIKRYLIVHENYLFTATKILNDELTDTDFLYLRPILYTLNKDTESIYDKIGAI